MGEQTAQEPIKILLVGDYASTKNPHDLAFNEAAQSLYQLAADKKLPVTVDTVSVDSFNTAQTAAVVAEAARRGDYDIIYHNTAPRRDKQQGGHTEGRPQSDGEFLAYATTRSLSNKEVKIVGVFAGDEEKSEEHGYEHAVNTFALLPPGTEVHRVDSKTNGTQFRSRDIFPEHVIAAADPADTIKLLAPVDLPAPHPAEGREQIITEANKTAAQLLDNLQHLQSWHHGDARKAYVTVIGPEKSVHSLLKDAAAHFESAEVDASPLKFSKNALLEAAGVAAQLAGRSTLGERRTIVVLPGKNETLDTAETLYAAKLDNGTNILTSDPRALDSVHSHIEPESVETYEKQGRIIKLNVRGGIELTGTTTDYMYKAPAASSEITVFKQDGYGNLKLNISHKDLLQRLHIGEGEGMAQLGAGDRAYVNVMVGGNPPAEAIIAGSSFEQGEKVLVLSKGSSGWPSQEGTHDENNFAELFIRGKRAADELKYHDGDKISIKLRRIERNQSTGNVVSGEGLQAQIPAPHQNRAVK